MPWLALLTSADPSPADNVIGPAVASLLGYGVTGLALLVLGWLYSRGWRLVSPAREKTIRDEDRADLLTQIERGDRAIERLEQDKRGIEKQRDEAQEFTSRQLVPLLVQFTATTSALIPLLQRLVGYQEGGSSIDPRRRQR